LAVEDASETSAFVRLAFEPHACVVEVLLGPMEFAGGVSLVGQQRPEARKRHLGGVGLAGDDVAECERLGVAVAEQLDEAFGQWVVGFEVWEVALDRGRRYEIEAGLVAVA